MKYFDTIKAPTAVATAADWAATTLDPATFNTLCVPVVGAAINQRIGRDIRVMKIKIRGSIRVSPQANQTAGDAAAIIRLLLVQDEQTNATQMTGTQLMTTAASAPLAINSFQSTDNFGRFRVLKDKTITMQNPNISYDGTNMEQQGLLRHWRMNVKFKVPVRVRFNATNGGTIADIVDNSFHILANCAQSDLVPELSYQCRVCYKE